PFPWGVGGGEPVPRLGLGLGVVEDALTIRVEHVISGTESRLTSALSVEKPRKPHTALWSLAISQSESAGNRHPISGFLHRHLRTCGTCVELCVADDTSHSGYPSSQKFPKNM